jgi:DNA-binding NtrC family response regulator
MAVVDHDMPDMDGLVVITKLKEIDPTIRTLLLTGHGDEKLREATQALNSHYFEKEEMNKFWSFIRRNLQSLEKHMAAAGMATGGDIEDALAIESPREKKR